ncbi:MAG: carbohydrate-binding protein, partial [Sphingobacteriaceae bacterium]
AKQYATLPDSGKTATPANAEAYYKKDMPFKYWIAYEYCWTTNTAIPEARWKANIDWVDTTFKAYGYDMICNDGWIEGAQTIDANGYITKYNDGWVNNFAYWGEYLAKKNMRMGVYYNPMWLTKAAYDKNVPVTGTKYHARDIVGPKSFNGDLYWVDAAKPGAKEWIQGYVAYFMGAGAKYLRIDFLENYENNYGTEKYAQVLHWIKQTACDKLFLSLVMPNCFDHGKTELLYGDMIRIDDDCFNGGWDFVSARRRGEHKKNWPQYGNAFDGFVSFADIGGRGQMVLDGDFIRLNTLANDDERRFQVSLFTIAGSPITIADQYDTIKEHAWAYQNNELIDLTDQGFIGKPLSYDLNDKPNSSIWTGQLPDGDWVVALFNREEMTEERKIDFAKDLGITGGAVENVRDLWAHTDLGKMTGTYTVNLAPHTCRVLKIRNVNWGRYEAEVASMIGVKKNNAIAGYTGGGYADKLGQQGAKILFTINTNTAGMYKLTVKHSNVSRATQHAGIYINNLKIKGAIKMHKQADAAKWGYTSKNIQLAAGINQIAIQSEPDNDGEFSIDHIVIKQD